MLVIRAPQLRALATSGDHSFVRRMVHHLWGHFPARCAPLSDQELVEKIWLEVDRAKTFGFRTEREACKFLNLVFTLGDGFENDPRNAWMLPLLDPESPRAPRFRLDELCARAAEVLAARERAAADPPPEPPLPSLPSPASTATPA